MINAEQERVKGAKPTKSLKIALRLFLVLMQSLYLREREWLHRA